MISANYTSADGIVLSRSAGVLRITIDRPEARNALDTPQMRALASIFQTAPEDPEVRVIVLTGAGRVFSAGGDVASMQEKIDKPELWDEVSTALRAVIMSLVACNKPIIARINGHAIGFGATLALFCDAAVADETIRIADAHAAAGLVAGDGAYAIWPMLIGLNRAKEWLLTGAPLTGRRAADIGLIGRAVSADCLDKTTDALVEQFNAAPLAATQATKRLLNAPLRKLLNDSIDTALALSAESNLSAAHQEAVTAFLQKRTPDFSGL